MWGHPAWKLLIRGGGSGEGRFDLRSFAGKCTTNFYGRVTVMRLAGGVYGESIPRVTMSWCGAVFAWQIVGMGGFGGF